MPEESGLNRGGDGHNDTAKVLAKDKGFTDVAAFLEQYE